MKCAIIIADGVRQVMMTAENASEQQALDIIKAPGQNVSIDFKEGTLYDSVPPSAFGFTIAKCKGGFLRAFEESKTSLMIVLTDNQEPQTKP